MIEYDEALIEQVPIHPNRSGLPYYIWLALVQDYDGVQLVVSNTAGGFFNRESHFMLTIEKNPIVLTPDSVDITPEHLEDVKSWVSVNNHVLANMQVKQTYDIGDFEKIVKAPIRHEAE